MKRIIALAAALILLCGCEFRCDICGESARHRVKAISVWWLCDECYDDYIMSGSLPGRDG